MTGPLAMWGLGSTLALAGALRVVADARVACLHTYSVKSSGRSMRGGTSEPFLPEASGRVTDEEAPVDVFVPLPAVTVKDYQLVQGLLKGKAVQFWHGTYEVEPPQSRQTHQSKWKMQSQRKTVLGQRQVRK